MSTAAMNMDIKRIINTTSDTICRDAKLREQFEKNPASVVRRVINKNLPEVIFQHVTNAVRVQVSVKTMSEIAGSLKNLL